MKKTLFIILLLFVLGLYGLWLFTFQTFQELDKPNKSFSQQEDGASQSSEVRLAIWPDYVSPKVLAKFEELTGIKVILIEYTGTYGIEPLLVEQGNEIDLVIADNSTKRVFEKKRLIDKFDRKELTNLNSISDDFRGYPEDPGNDFLIPYSWGITLIAYNTNLVEGTPKSWKDFNHPDKPIGVFDDKIDHHAIGCFLSGTDPASDKVEDLETGREAFYEFLETRRIQLGEPEDLRDLLLAGELAMCMAFSPDAKDMAYENDHVKWYVPEEGAMFYVDNFMLTKQCLNRENAHKLVNFLSRPEIAAENAEDVGYDPVNKGVLEQSNGIELNQKKLSHYVETLPGRKKIYDEIYKKVTGYKSEGPSLTLPDSE